MTLRDFLDAAYTLLVEEYRTHTRSLPEALEEAELWRSGGPPDRVDGAPVVAQNERSVERENTKSMAELQKMMSGVAFGGAG